MSAIAGVFSRDGGTEGYRWLGTVSQHLSDMGPDGEHCAAATDVRMLFMPFFTDRAMREVQQPLRASDGYIMCFDGRLDNRMELVGTKSESITMSDGETALSIYRQRGALGFSAMVGEFALALWDPYARRLVLCCDALGRRPLYYTCTDRCLAWCSRSRPLRSAPGGLGSRIDETFIADYLVNRPSSASPFQEVVPVPPGHAVLVGKVDTMVRQYWAVTDVSQTGRVSDEDYEAECLELFREAVACRLRSDAPVYIELSGGVDSSAIACMAHRLFLEGHSGAPSYRTVSYMFEESVGSDEAAYVDAVERELGHQGWHVPEAECPLFAPCPTAFTPDLPSPNICFITRHDLVTKRMHSEGARVLLSGIGGDHTFWSQPDIGLLLSDFVAKGEFGALLSQTREWSRFLGRPFWKTLAQAVMPLAPRCVRAAWQSLPDWFDERFVRRTGLRRRTVRASAGGRHELPTTEAQRDDIVRASRPFALEQCSTEGYLDRRYPFLDRRLAEFSVRIPADVKIRFAESRAIIRRSLRGIVPAAVLQRRTKAGPGEALNRALAREWPRIEQLLDTCRVAEHGFVDQHRFRQALDRARYGHAPQQTYLLRTLSLELWLRTLE